MNANFVALGSIVARSYVSLPYAAFIARAFNDAEERGLVDTDASDFVGGALEAYRASVK